MWEEGGREDLKALQLLKVSEYRISLSLPRSVPVFSFSSSFFIFTFTPCVGTRCAFIIRTKWQWRSEHETVLLTNDCTWREETATFKGFD